MPPPDANAPGLDRRSRAILLETINEYVVTAEPVGSRIVSRKLSEPLSPATVRNVMADLEDMGFLSQPHTSAGRVPTDRAYRFFVNELLCVYRASESSESSVPVSSPLGEEETPSLQEVLGAVCHRLSTHSRQTSLVLFPNLSTLSLKRIEFIRLSEKQVLAVFASSQGQAQNRMLRLKEDLDQNRLTSIANYLNTEFAGRPLVSIRKELQRRLRNEEARYQALRKKAFDLWVQVFTREDQTELLVEGLNHLLDQPEFQADLNRIKALLKTVEEKKKLIELLDLCMHQEGLSVIIGEEHPIEEMQGCSLIAQTYSLQNESLGTVGIFGPKRMDYPKMIEIVHHSAVNVSDFLSRQSG